MPEGQERGAALPRETPTLSAPIMTQRNKHLAGWPPVAGNLGRPDLRRDAVEPNQCGDNYRQPYLLRAAVLFAIESAQHSPARQRREVLA